MKLEWVEGVITKIENETPKTVVTQNVGQLKLPIYWQPNISNKNCDSQKQPVDELSVYLKK
mgnify:CR=1 FL=1